MGNIFTRKALNDIMANEGLTPEQRTEAVFGLYGRALDDGYIAKSAAQQAQETALANAKTEWEKGFKAPDPKESEDYKTLLGQFNGYKAMQEARTSDAYKGIKGKFFETVYGMVDRADGAQPVEEQLKGIREKYEEYFEAEDQSGSGSKKTPQFSQQSGRSGSNPTSEEDKLYQQLSSAWN